MTEEALDKALYEALEKAMGPSKVNISWILKHIRPVILTFLNEMQIQLSRKET
jgi:hypothetical protein